MKESIDKMGLYKLTIFIIMIVVLLYLGYSRYTQVQLIKQLKFTISEKSNALMATSEVVTTKEQDRTVKETEIIIKSTGFDTNIIKSDEALAISFFKPAFNWRSADDYDSARNQYINDLGEDNTFTSAYLPKNIIVQRESGPDTSSIEMSGMLASYDSMTVVPLVAVGNSVKYVAFVKYYMLQNIEDLAAGNKLTASNALIEFTVSGDPTVGMAREVSEVQAWNDSIIGVK